MRGAADRTGHTQVPDQRQFQTERERVDPAIQAQHIDFDSFDTADDDAQQSEQIVNSSRPTCTGCLPFEPA